jgi:hypothetical protein
MATKALSYIEHQARQHWKGWANYLQHTQCGHCKSFTYCGRTDSHRPWTCLDCFDQGKR